MHHGLRFYARYRELFLRYYIFQSSFTKIPLIGQLVRKVANLYGQKQHNAYLLRLEEAQEIIEISPEVFLGPCSCRKIYKNCQNSIESEILLSFDSNPFFQTRPEAYRLISKSTAKEILKENQRKGLLLTLIKCQNHYYAICACCTCCCVPLRLLKNYGIGKALLRDKKVVELFKQSLI